MQGVPSVQADRSRDQVTWQLGTIANEDSGLRGTALLLLRDLQRYDLVWQRYGTEVPGNEELRQWSITPDGESVLERLAEPEETAL
jgi:hypothetical protein